MGLNFGSLCSGHACNKSYNFLLEEAWFLFYSLRSILYCFMEIKIIWIELKK